MKAEKTLAEKCKDYLNERWKYISELFENDTIIEPLDDKNEEIKKLIFECLTSKTKTYRYVLPTQLLSKTVEHSLDCHSLQVAYSKKGVFDARTVAHSVIVPFDQANFRVLGGSAEPYVNNPLRYPAVIEEYKSQQKNQKDWEKLIRILDEVEGKDNKNFTKKVFDQILFEIYKLLSNVHIPYPIPKRISLNQTLQLVKEFTKEKSGGERIEAICTALFKTVKEIFNLFDEVKREKVTAADASSGMVADIECYLNKKIVLLVEVKDRSLTLTYLDAKLSQARAKRISEILFLAEQGVKKEDVDEVNKRVSHEFTSGQNVYVSNFLDFSYGLLILFGETGRVNFLENVGKELDRVNAEISHRRAWSELLKKI